MIIKVAAGSASVTPGYGPNRIFALRTPHFDHPAAVVLGRNARPATPTSRAPAIQTSLIRESGAVPPPVQRLDRVQFLRSRDFPPRRDQGVDAAQASCPDGPS